MDTSEQAIGIFDSGVGGLTVLKAIQEQLPHETLIYLGDTARVPYGCKSASTIRHYARQNAKFLEQFSIKLLIVACNTATAFALEELNTFCPFPVLGVILPGAQEAVSRSRHQKIGVLATRSTVKSGAYERAIHFFDPKALVLSQPAPLLVPLVEENLMEHSATSLLMSEYLNPLICEGVDTLLLGCTHFPLLKPLIQRLLGGSLAVVDSATSCASKVADMLKKLNLERKSGPCEPPRFFITDDDPEGFSGIGERLLGLSIPKVEVVSLEAQDAVKARRCRTRQNPQTTKRKPKQAPAPQGQGAITSASMDASASCQ